MTSKGGDKGAGDDLALAARAAWLYHAGGLTQSQVAQRLGVPSSKAHRLITRATRAGVVRVLIEGPIAGCAEAEAEIARRFGLRLCRVVPGLGEPEGGDALPLRALGAAAASFLYDVLTREEHRVIGVGHGRTLGAALDKLPAIAAPNTCFVSLLGGLTRRTGTNPFDVIHRLAEKTGGEAWLLPVPFIANAAADRAVLLAQRGIGEAVALAAQATLCLVGIGEVTGAAFLPTSGVISPGEVEALLAAGAAGEMLGHYFDRHGRRIETSLHDRVISIMPPAGPRDGKGCLVVGVAGGEVKTAAIQAVLRSGLLNGFITDEPTAQRLLADEHAHEIGKGNGECTIEPRMSSRDSSPAGSAAGS